MDQFPTQPPAGHSTGKLAVLCFVFLVIGAAIGIIAYILWLGGGALSQLS